MVLPLHRDSDGRKALPEQPLPGGVGLTLRRGRVHELCGPSRVCLAALILSISEGPVIWVSPGWQTERIYPPGLRELADPGRIIFARARRPEDVLWAMEEALRTGAAPIVVADMPAPPALTPVRRLHLACEAGAETARHRRRPGAAWPDPDARRGRRARGGKPLADGHGPQRIGPCGKRQRLGHASPARPHGPACRLDPEPRCRRKDQRNQPDVTAFLTKTCRQGMKLMVQRRNPGTSVTHVASVWPLSAAWGKRSATEQKGAPWHGY